MSDNSNIHFVSPLAFERMFSAVEKVRDRLHRASNALAQAPVPYAVIGGHAVAAWISEVDEAAVRNTPDVDILLRRADFDRAKAALTTAGFIYQHASGIHMFLDGSAAKTRDAVRLVFAGEKVRPDDLAAAPDVVESKTSGTFNALNLEPLLRMKLTANRNKDRVHVQDLISVGLVDASWLDRLPQELRECLQVLLDNPDG